MYYAMFHAGFAALLKYGITPPKDKIGHDWLQANFSQHLIRQRKVFSAKFRSSLSDAQNIMELNFKQEEIIDQLAKEIEAKYPEVKFVRASQSPASANTLWLEFTKPENEDRMIEIFEYGGVRTMDILEEYGYHFLVMPVVENGELAKAS